MGNLAAICTAICWAITSILFSITSKKIGSITVNRLRLLVASVFLMIIHLVIYRQLIPTTFSLDRWAWLGLSGVVGLTLGDAFLFQAYVMIGPRLSTVMMALVPVASTILAWLVLGEKLSLLVITGICITVAGVAWVVLEEPGEKLVTGDRRHFLLGIACGLGSVLGQSFGLILSKRGLEGGVSALSGVLIRILVAMAVLWVYSALRGQIGSTLQVFRMPGTIGTIATASAIGPVLGVWLSLVSVQLIPVGIASTLQSLTPIFVLPMTLAFFKERVTARAIFGTLGAIAGVAVIFLLP